MIDHLFAGNTLSLQLERRLNVETFKARETKVNTWSESSPLQWRDIRSRRVRSCCGLPSRTASMRRLTILPNTIRDDPKEMGARACKLLACTRAITLFFSPPSFFPFLFFFFPSKRKMSLYTFVATKESALRSHNTSRTWLTFTSTDYTSPSKNWQRNAASAPELGQKYYFKVLSNVA